MNVCDHGITFGVYAHCSQGKLTTHQDGWVNGWIERLFKSKLQFQHTGLPGWISGSGHDFLRMCTVDPDWIP